MKAVNIEWDVDFEEDLEDLPTEMEIPEGMTDEEEISDWLSDEIGFCHNGFILVSMKKKFSIPVTWQVWDKIEVEAETIEEAVAYVKEHIDEIPLGTEPEYIDGSYRIDDGDDGDASVEETVRYLREYWNLSGGIDGEEIV